MSQGAGRHPAFELPSRYRTLLRPTVRFARWDLTTLDLVAPRTGTLLCELHPQDKLENADGKRRPLEPIELVDTPARDRTGASSSPVSLGRLAPHLETLMDRYEAEGLPPGYLAHPSGPASATAEAMPEPRLTPSPRTPLDATEPENEP